MPPLEPNSISQACKLIFFHPMAARELIIQFRKLQHPHFSTVEFNRHGYRETQDKILSRVIDIEGPPSLMTYQWWYSFFKNNSSRFTCEYHRFLPASSPEKLRMEFRFARVEGQSQPIMKAILADESLQNVVDAVYGRNPCDPLQRHSGLYQHLHRQRQRIMGQQQPFGPPFFGADGFSGG